jgi:hypothetical protein
MNGQREAHKKIRSDLRSLQKAVMETIRSSFQGEARFAAVSVAKMEHTFAQSAIANVLRLSAKLCADSLQPRGPAIHSGIF